MKSVLILEVNDSRWAEIVSKSINYDFYHTQSYHLLELKKKPILFVAFIDQDFIAIPVLIREIKNTSHVDGTSAYGYCGPISNIDFEKLSKELITYFQTQLLSYFKKGAFVSAFSRLNPIFSNGAVFKNFGDLVNVNQTVIIDTSVSEELQKKRYRKSVAYDIKQLRKSNITIFEATKESDIDTFKVIYKSTMKKVAASFEYYLSDPYFNDFLNAKDFEKIILLAKQNDVINAGAVFTITNGVMQYHLSGTLEYEGKYSPMKLIIDEARILATKRKCNYLHLGGGFGGSDKDSLFQFKSGFSDLRCNYQSWNLIVDQKKYKELTLLNKSCINDSGFFPLYRTIEMTSPKIYLFGSSGHAKVIIDILQLNKEEIVSIFVDRPAYSELLGIPVQDYTKVDFIDPINKFIIAVGDNFTRKQLSSRWKGGYKMAFHPKAVISSNVEISEGSVIMANAIVNSGSIIGKHVIINTGALVEHDCKIENFSHISPMAALAGNVTVGEGTQIGINATVKQGITIGKWAIIGAGAVIIKDVPDFAVVVGNPGRIIKYTSSK
jgi:sugar O-acyltransferase (sialic acid O-acetyltransferase NeuD family)